ncbi:hypothetical protein D3C87_1376120 [compost metagenome]
MTVYKGRGGVDVGIWVFGEIGFQFIYVVGFNQIPKVLVIGQGCLSKRKAQRQEKGESNQESCPHALLLLFVKVCDRLTRALSPRPVALPLTFGRTGG